MLKWNKINKTFENIIKTYVLISLNLCNIEFNTTSEEVERQFLKKKLIN